MSRSDDSQYDARGLSTTQIVIMFLAAVAVCAVFFSAGFLVGYNERVSKAIPLTERVTGSAEIPPLVTPDSSGSASDSSRNPTSATPDKAAQPAPDRASPLRPEPLTPVTAEVRRPEPKAAIEARTPPAVVSRPQVVTSKPGADGKTGPVPPPQEIAGGVTATFIIQVAATSTKPDAEKMVEALTSLGYPVSLMSPEQAHAGDNLFRVHVGPFATRESADKIRNRLMLDGFKQPFIKH